MTITTTLELSPISWPNDKAHYQMRADQTYTAQSDAWVTGKFNPHGEVGIRRFFQARTPGTCTLGSPVELNTNTKDRPANSPFSKSHQIRNYGPYMPDQSTLMSNSLLSVNDVYGVETIELMYVDDHVTPNTQTILDYQKIDIYYPLPSAAANFYVQNFQQKIALNTSTAGTKFGGDPPRAIMNTTQTIYPGAETWVVIYPGVAQATPPWAAEIQIDPEYGCDRAGQRCLAAEQRLYRSR